MNHVFARRLRREQTDVERKLCYALRDRRLSGIKFRRQQPIDRYIVDFVCFDAMLVIELDGAQHTLPENRATDEVRTRFLESRGYRVLRFFNHEINDNFGSVIDAVFQATGTAK